MNRKINSFDFCEGGIMLSNISKMLLVLTLMFLFGGLSFAQSDSPNSKPDPTKNMDLPDGIRENLAKTRLKAEQEEYKELIKKSEEAAKISQELTETYKENQKLLPDDAKKIERLEKVVKKIRQELGAEDDNDSDADIAKPSTLMNTLATIKDKTADLLSELKKTSRYSVSVVAIESSNALLRLVRFIKFIKK